MRPAVVLVGFVLGSAAAITFALFGVVVVFTWLKPEYPRLGDELPSLWGSLGLFAVLTGAAAASFYGLLRTRGWRRPAIVALLLTLGAVSWYHWPR